MHDILNRLYKLKVILLALVTAVLGLALLFFAKWAQTAPGWQWTTSLPIFELGSTLFITGSLVIAWNYIDGKDREVREDARLRRLLEESAPAFRDAVVRAVSPYRARTSGASPHRSCWTVSPRTPWRCASAMKLSRVRSMAISGSTQPNVVVGL